MPNFFGTGGDDSITGTAGADVIQAGWGDDIVDGGSGDDVISDDGGSNILRGGGGDDVIRLEAYWSRMVEFNVLDSGQIEAGDGNDDVSIRSGVGQHLTVDLGAGRDLFTVRAWGVRDDSILLTTGAGSDRITFDFNYGDILRFRIGYPALVVTDFAAGAGGDVLDLGNLLKAALAFTTPASNPFASGHLNLIQDGADTIVRLDFDGTGGGSSETYLRDIVRLKDVSAASLTSENLAGYAPNGAALARTARVGTESGDWLAADIGGSDLLGLGGDDRLTGGLAADVIDGGLGNDVLVGGDGDDVLRGGDGADTIRDGYGNDVVEGGGGNDVIELFRPSQPFYRPPLHETIRVDAGDGDDIVSFAIGGGDGEFRSVALTIDLGAGNDRLVFPHLVRGAQATLGAGQDRIVFGENYFGAEYYQSDPTYGEDPLRILDFQPGLGGDVIELDRVAWGPGWNMLDNPFATGHLRLEQSGADTLIIHDYDGNGSGTSVFTIVRFVGLTASSLTAHNLSGYAPDGASSAFAIGAGTAGDDHLFDSYDSDTIDGGAGNDVIEVRKTGSDSLSGGDGDDRLIVAHTLSTSDPNLVVTVDGGTGNDQVDFIADAHLDANLGAGNDRIILRSTGNGSFLTLGGGSDTVVLGPNLSGYGIEPIVIEDFATGAGGDLLDWALFAEIELIELNITYDAQFQPVFDATFPVADFNPFLTGDAQLVQSGADTLLQIRGNQYGRFPGQPVTLVTFRNTQAGSFTAENLGFELFRTTADGTSANDSLTGGSAADVINGNGGDDVVAGLTGDDILRGHDGADQLSGSDGRDRLEGGAGDDTLAGGNDADYLNGAWGRDVVDGGAGDDVILDLFSRDEIRGGDGNDTIAIWGYDDVLPSGSTSPGSIDAGAGNDVVYLYSGANGTGYSVDLGAGDDYITFGSPPASLLLGAGRDTVAYTGSAWLGLTLVDFTPGNSGDVFDLRAYLKPDLGMGTAWPLIEKGANPFVLGYVALRQVGADVELIFQIGGAPAPGRQPVRFLNTTLDQFTAANFGGYDPDAVPDATRTLVVGNMTIGAGSHLETVDLPPWGDFGWWNAHYVVPETATTSAAFVNNGEIVSRLTRVPLGDLVGFLVESHQGGSFVNASSARFIVRAEWIDESGVLDQGWTYGFRASGPLSFRNDGYFEVRAASGTVSAVMAGFDPLTNYPIVNNGTVVAVAPENVYAFDLGTTGRFTNTGTVSVEAGLTGVGAYYGGGISPLTENLFTNSGTIDVYAGEYAVGVFMDGYDGNQINNSGQIIARNGPGSPYASVGIFIYQGTTARPPLVHVNSGLIEADIAFEAYDFGTFFGNPDHLINSGTINGLIRLNRGDDRVVNSGTITSSTLLGSGNDRYEGGEGRHFGTVEGGNGNDVLIGGASAENLFGDSDDDVIHGGGGDDFIEGGAGFDRLDGGAGFDILSFYESYLPVTVDLAAGTATDNMATDLIAGFEFVIGSRIADQLLGSAAAEIFVGLGGGDRLDGRGGDDVLHGGIGNDVLVGGTGNDRFLFEHNDGQDQIEDFAAGDLIEVYGYAAAQSVAQAGSDVLVTLGPSDTILVRNASVAGVVAALQYSSAPLALDTPTYVDRPLTPGEHLVIAEGVEIAVTNPVRMYTPPSRFDYVALVRTDFDGDFAGHLFNAGTLSILVETDDVVVGVFGMGALVNSTTGALSVVGEVDYALGTFGVPEVWNYGSITVRSVAGDATGISDLGKPLVGGQFFNAGTIRVDAAGTAIGVGQDPMTSLTGARLFNAGLIDVHGGEASFGFDYRAAEHPLNPPAFIVNSGTIKVTDETAALDSAGILFEVSGPTRIWNSGTIEADYSFRRTSWVSGAPPGAYLAIYNSGQLNGHFEGFGGTFAIDTSLINTGAITGNVVLANGNDLYDGRLGMLTGTLSGDGGNDVLLAGAGDQLISGGLGDDLLSGGVGTDLLTGGVGADTFRFEAGYGIDTIADFGAGDRIEVGGYSSWSSIAQQGADVVVIFDAANKLTFANQTLANVTADRFTFNAAAIAANVIPVAPTPNAPPAMPTRTSPVLPLPLFGTAATEDLFGTGAADMVYGYAGNDQFFLQQGGSDWADGGAGSDGFFFGAALDGSDVVDGNVGTDSLAIQGNYADLVLTGMVKVEVLYVAPGSDTRFGDLAGNSYDYVIRSADANVAAGAALTVIGAELRAGEDLRFDGSAETNGNFRIFAGRGADTLTGGRGNDGFFFGADGNLTGADRIDGGEGIDSIALRGNYVGARAVVFDAASITNVEVIAFLSGHTNEFGGFIDTNGFDYDITLPDQLGMGGRLIDVNATALRSNEGLRFDAGATANSAVRILSGAGDDTLRGSGNADILYGNLGADQIDGGGGNDSYLYRGVAESTAAARDTLAFAAGDRIDLSFIDANTATQANDAFAFIGSAAFSNVAGQLRAFQSGAQWLVEGDINGDGVADLVIAVTGATNLAAGDFVL